MTQIGTNAPNTSRVILVANKKDMEKSRVVSYDEGLELSQKYKIHFFETSAFNGENIPLAFETLGKEIVTVINEKPDENGKSDIMRIFRFK